MQFASLLYDKCCMVTFLFFFFASITTYDHSFFKKWSLQACGHITRECALFPVLRLRLCPSCQTEKLFLYFYFFDIFFLNFNHLLFIYFSLVTLGDLLIQYPNADLIDALPAWRSYKCFKPEAHLMIEKFLSLKKESSRNIFIANMTEHTRARYEVSSIFFFFLKILEERLKPQHLLFLLLALYDKGLSVVSGRLWLEWIYRYTLKISRYKGKPSLHVITKLIIKTTPWRNHEQNRQSEYRGNNKCDFVYYWPSETALCS